jgi:hypothetical protein
VEKFAALDWGGGVIQQRPERNLSLLFFSQMLPEPA